jgi:ketosteroid isomerase-like protein
MALGRIDASNGGKTIVTPTIEQQIQALVDLETEGWNRKDPDLFLSIIHPDMVWAWPPSADAHDPVDWVFVMGRFDRERWRNLWMDLFATHDLVRNIRHTRKIMVTEEGDGALAVVDIDTLWRHKETGAESLWKGRVSKTYTRLANGEWKLISHSGVLHYPA